MDVLWSKDRLHKIFSKESIRLNVTHGSGDGGGSPLRGCRLCGGEGNLRRFCETYLWEGVEERYDQLLYNCFGVRALPTDGMICERCICQLRNTQRFHALVQSAFARPPSEYSTNQSQVGIGEGFTKQKIKSKSKASRYELAKKSTRSRTCVELNVRKRGVERKKSILNPQTQVRRVNIACEVCKQKYPMLIPFEGSKKFVCSRCKKKGDIRVNNCSKYDANMPMANVLGNHLELHPKTELKGRSRLFSVQKIPSNSVKTPNNSELKYHTSNRCFKKYTVAQNLTKHISNTHKNTYGCVCTKCQKDLKTEEMLDKHMRMHTGQPIYKCDVCMRNFKGKRTFQTHYLTHEK